ncbi:helix-turn-helix domain-containing protein [Corallococcus sp. 4LFB]|uniref:helix-turn-helix domain-containing protein n=1 Tax=Corallococcus sp. 4LFB TaxID=3383249 RepID=UPI0039750BBB
MSEGQPNPEKLRRAIVRAFHDEGLAYAQIAHLQGIGEATVSRVLRLYRETGDVVPRPKGGGNFSPIRGKVTTEIKRLVGPEAGRKRARADGRVDGPHRRCHQPALNAMGPASTGLLTQKSPSPPESVTRRKTSGAGASSPRS